MVMIRYNNNKNNKTKEKKHYTIGLELPQLLKYLQKITFKRQPYRCFLKY